MRGPLAAAAALLLSASALHAQDCPTAADGKRGFVVERGEQQKSEIFHVEGGAVRSVMRYDGKTLLEQTLFAGLFPIERLESGRRTVSTPKTELASLMPLKAGRRVVALFIRTDNSGRTTPVTIALSAKSADPLFIGPCKYPVLRIEQTETHGENPTKGLSAFYYSPELKLILMREFQYSGGRNTLIKFDKIYRIK